MRRLAVVALLCGACAAAPASASGAAWRSCGERLQCARVDVPFDWSRPGGRRMSLPVVRYRAPGPGPRVGSLFVNGGGATGSVDLVRTTGATLAAQLGG